MYRVRVFLWWSLLLTQRAKKHPNRRGQRSSERDRSGREVRVSVANESSVDQSHTIVLFQPSSFESRTYHDYETLPLALEGTSFTIKADYLFFFLLLGILKIYEQELKREHPTQRNITYDIKDLYRYIDDSVKDISCLVYVFLHLALIARLKPHTGSPPTLLPTSLTARIGSNQIF